MRKTLLFLVLILAVLSISNLAIAKSTTNTSNQKVNGIQLIPVDHNQEVDGILIHVSHLAYSKNELALYVESTEKGSREDYSRAGDVEFHISDEKGKRIKSYSGEVTGVYFLNKWIFNSEKKYDPIPKNTKELTITPYTKLPTDGGGSNLDNNEEIITDYSKLKDVHFQSFKVKINQ